ncbi:MAG: AAA family ATPase [Fimbriimonadaceae bacterium]|nr:AAA family ATPase [Fimbriimonadaceae bacterium]
MSSTLINSSDSKLAELTGLEMAKRVVRKVWASDSPVHAVLFHGASGTGKTSISNILAQAWMCREPGESGACGKCRSCEAFERENSIDFFRIVPEGASNWIRVSAIRRASIVDPPMSVQEFLRTLPIVGARKVILIENADRIYHDAFNSLLKMLEEPPAYGRFVLTTSQLSLVPTTIRSRCICVQTDFMGDELGEGASLWDRFCIAAPGEVADIRAQEPTYRRLIEFTEALPNLPLGAELRAAEELRSIAEEYAAKTDQPMRFSQAKVLEGFARSLQLMDAAPESVIATLEAHRRIIGNANAGIVFDALLLEIAVGLGRSS